MTWRLCYDSNFHYQVELVCHTEINFWQQTIRLPAKTGEAPHWQLQECCYRWLYGVTKCQSHFSGPNVVFFLRKANHAAAHSYRKTGLVNQKLWQSNRTAVLVSALTWGLQLHDHHFKRSQNQQPWLSRIYNIVSHTSQCLNFWQIANCRSS